MAPRNRLAASMVACLLIASCCPFGLLAEDSRLLRDGDRVVLLGGTFIERMQTHGYLEMELTSVLRTRNLTFRNLGWSGDNVRGESRAVFGSIEDGYARLLRDLKLASPSVVLIHYGIVEARAGPAGLEGFRQGLKQLVDDIQRLDARVVLLLPRPQVAMPFPFPAADAFNESLDPYRSAIVDLAKLTGSAMVDLDAPGTTRLPSGSRGGREGRTKGGRTPFQQGLSVDGVQLTAEGYWEQAAALAAALGGNRDRAELKIDIQAGRVDAAGVTAEWDTLGDDHVVITYQRSVLTRFVSPREGDTQLQHAAGLSAWVKGMPPGKYHVTISPGGWGPVLLSSRQLAAGVTFPGVDEGQLESLRKTIAQKNEYFFHRYRPQNETYLFLFRKHEQGNNAVEIPMFDPLVESLDREIRRLSVPPIRTLRLQRRPTQESK